VSEQYMDSIMHGSTIKEHCSIDILNTFF